MAITVTDYRPTLCGILGNPQLQCIDSPTHWARPAQGQRRQRVEAELPRCPNYQKFNPKSHQDRTEKSSNSFPCVTVKFMVPPLWNLRNFQLLASQEGRSQHRPVAAGARRTHIPGSQDRGTHSTTIHSSKHSRSLFHPEQPLQALSSPLQLKSSVVFWHPFGTLRLLLQ